MTINADMVMDTYFAQDKLQELRRTINLQHLNYLEMEETPEKIEERNKLEDYIKEYLCLAPHNKKFFLPETAQVLHRSASIKKDFSGYRAAIGWSAIGMYAANLLAQPWRKEYKRIKMYSGFYKHQIEANLVGAETMFESMGYKYDRNYSILTMDDPVCPDRLILVSQDSLVAYVECQILKTIWEEVSKSFKISWLEVLEFRETHLCSPKQSVLALTYRFQEKQYQQHNRSFSQGNEPFPNTGARWSTMGGVHASTSALPSTHSFPPIHPHIPPVVSMPSGSQYVYGSNGYFPNNYATYAPLLPTQHYPCSFPMTCTQSVMKPCHTNNYCCANGYSAGIPHEYVSHPIPTAQLVDIDPRTNIYDVPDANLRTNGVQSGLPLQQVLYNENARNNPHLNTDKEIDKEYGRLSESSESWDYVYRNLESQGYSKDLGERGDLLSANLESKKNKSISIKKTGLEETLNNISISKKASKTKDTEKFDSLISKREPENRNSSLNGTAKMETTPRKSSINKVSSGLQESLSKKNEMSKSKTINPKKVKQSIENNFRDKEEKGKVRTDIGISETDISKEWHCSTCTFLNKEEKNICEMCGKSRNAVEDVMEVGGSECPKCTLVNPKNMNYCKACHESLANSGTYI